MSERYFSDILYSKENYSGKKLFAGDYEDCTFSECNFQEAILSGVRFLNCRFVGCDLSMIKTAQTVFHETSFTACKIIGVHFEHCIPMLFSVSFMDCTLDYSSFFGCKLPNTIFKNCQIQEVDFGEADLTKAVFDQCNLNRSVFQNTLLEQADFRTAQNYSLDPEKNKIRNAKFSVSGLAGLLGKYEIQIE